MRTKNSCRVGIYYKLERRDERTLCWKVLQKTYEAADDARKDKKQGDRMMKFNGKDFEVYEL